MTSDVPLFVQVALTNVVEANCPLNDAIAFGRIALSVLPDMLNPVPGMIPPIVLAVAAGIVEAIVMVPLPFVTVTFEPAVSVLLVSVPLELPISSWPLL